MNPHRKPLALLLPALFALPAGAAEQLAALDNIVVSATRQAQRASEVLTDVSVIEEAQIRAAGPNATINDLLALQPGIELNHKGGPGTDSSVFIRGSNNNHALVLVDGMRLGSLTLGAPSWGFIPLEQVERVEIIRGSCSSLYGSDAIGGVIQIFTKRGDGQARVFAEAAFGSWHTASQAAGFSGGSEGWRYNFQLGHKSSDAYTAINNPKNASYNPDRDGYEISSSSGSVSYALAAGHEIGFSYMVADGWNRYDGWPGAANHKQQETVYGANVYSRNRVNAVWTSTLKVGQSGDFGQQYANGVAGSKIDSTQTQVQWQNDIALPVGTALVAAEHVAQAVSGSVAYTVKDRTVDSLLLGWHGNLGAHRAQLSGRYDDNSQFGGKTTGTAAYGYQLSRDWRANASVATGFKAPTFNDLYWPGAGNPNLQPETSTNREISVHYETERHHAWLTYYRNDIANLVEWAPGPGGLWLPSNVAKAELSGWTLAYAGVLADYRVAASLDLQDPQDVTNHTQLRYRAREIAKLAVNRDFGPFGLGAEVLASGKRYNDVANTQELGGYTVLNLSASYRVDRDWSLFARVNNLFDRQYVLVGDYTTPGFNAFVGLRYSPQ